VQRRDYGDLDRAQEVEDVLAVVAAPDVVVVLDRDDIHAGAEYARRAGIVIALVASDPVVDLEREGRAALGRQEDRDLAITRRGCQVARVGRDPVAAGGISGDECCPSDDAGPLDGSAPLRSRDGDGRAREPFWERTVPGWAVGRSRPRSVDLVDLGERPARVDEPLDPN